MDEDFVQSGLKSANRFDEDVQLIQRSIEFIVTEKNLSDEEIRSVSERETGGGEAEGEETCKGERDVYSLAGGRCRTFSFAGDD